MLSYESYDKYISKKLDLLLQCQMLIPPKTIHGFQPVGFYYMGVGWFQQS